MAGAAVQAASFAFLLGLLSFAGFLVGRWGHSSSRLSEGRLDGSGAPDFNPSALNPALTARLRTAVQAEYARPISTLTAQNGLAAHASGAEELRAASADALAALAAAFDPRQHQKLQRALGLLGLANERVHAALMAVAAPAADRLALQGAAAQGSSAGAGKVAAAKARSARSTLHVTVSEQPFGMHIRRGTLEVEEVFPGFPAEAAGVRRGCELHEIDGQLALPGSWMEIFQHHALPFELVLHCSGSSVSREGAKASAVVEDDGRYSVVVAKKPYGMNIQVNTVPRVVEVLPGYPAEAAGVMRGFVLVEVNGRPVDAKSWFEEYQSAKLPFSVTFDTQAPVLPNNTFFSSGAKAPADTAEEVEDGGSAASEREVFRCSVEALPFGMQVAARPGSRPTVIAVLPGSPAARAGVLVGDVLMEVAGRPVSSSTWFSSMQQASPPYGLLFERPVQGRPEPAAGAGRQEDWDDGAEPAE